MSICFWILLPQHYALCIALTLCIHIAGDCNQCQFASCTLPSQHQSQAQMPCRAADEKVKKSEQAGTFAQMPGDASKIDRFPEDVSTIVVHHSSILRNKRLLMAYRYVPVRSCSFELPNLESSATHAVTAAATSCMQPCSSLAIA